MSRPTHAARVTASAPRDPLGPLQSLLETLGPAGLVELERLVRLTLEPTPTAAERHWTELGALSELLEGRPIGITGIPLLEAKEYDSLRPQPSIAAKVLSKRYGSWSRACYAAFGLDADGTKRAPGQPWPHAFRRGRRPGAYSRAEVFACVRTCAFALGRRPSSADYIRWVSTMRALARARGMESRIATINAVYRHIPDAAPRRRWQKVLGAAAITDTEIANARAGRVPGSEPAVASGDGLQQTVDDSSPLAGLERLGRIELARVGLSEEERARLLSERDLGMTPFGIAVRLARELDVSLDWLVGRSPASGRSPSADLRLDGERFVALRKNKGIPERAVAKKLLVHEGRLRRIQRGTVEPLLFQVARMASILDVQINAICTTAPAANKFASGPPST